MIENGQSGRELARLSFAHPERDEAFVEIISLHEVRKRTTFQPSRIDFYCLQLVTEGTGCHWVDFERVPLAKGDCLLTGEGQVHWFDREANHHAHVVLFRPDAIPDRVGSQLRVHMRPRRLHLGDADAAAVEGVIEIMKLSQQTRGGMGTQAALRNLLLAILSCISQASPSPSKQASRAYAFALALDKQVAAWRDSTWYADQLGISARTLSRDCMDEFGLTAKAYIDQRVALEAKRLLAHTDWTIGRISSALEFSEPTNFAKFFHRVEGTTPRAFRARLREHR